MTANVDDQYDGVAPAAPKEPLMATIGRRADLWKVYRTKRGEVMMLVAKVKDPAMRRALQELEDAFIAYRNAGGLTPRDD